MKRNLSDSDADDVFDDSCKGTPTQSNDSCQMFSRKKRRGLIEKRRRDRINNSLTELRRLIPNCVEKQNQNAENLPLDVRGLLSPQGSAKLEKAEILQMTVDHLKMLHSKGLDSLAYDPHKLAMDYHWVGFRECAAEVARYLVTMEGMDVQDPLRLRLMSHLQCYSAQRELSSKPTPGWGSFNPPQHPNHFANSSNDHPHPSQIGYSEPRGQSMGGGELRLGPTGSGFPLPVGSGGGVSGVHQMAGNHQYPGNHCFSVSPTHYNPTASTSQAGPPVKPYRPWGTELAY